MDEEKRNQFIDDLLDAGLSRYGSVSPRPGLEGRILAVTNAARQRRTMFLWSGWLAAGATAAVVAVAILSFPRKQESPLVPMNPMTAATTIEADSGVGNGHVLKERNHPSARPQAVPAPRGVKGKVEEDPQQAVFPSPHPETKQERLLAEFVRNAPPSALEAFPSEQKPIPELTIKDLEIPPLGSDTDKVKNSQ